MKKRKLVLSLFWIGLLFAVAFAGIIGRSLYHNLRTLTCEESAMEEIESWQE